MSNIMSEDEIIARELEARKGSKKPRKVKLATDKPKEQKAKKPEPTESELVLKYAKRVMKKQQYHGRVDKEKFEGMEYKTVSKNLWMDTDFYFSVVFQSQEQKVEFLNAVKWADEEENTSFSIINGLELAKKLGIGLKLETTKSFPMGKLDLMPMVLDTEQVETNL